MGTHVFINVPVRDLAKSMDFFTKLGFSFNPQFADEKVAGFRSGEIASEQEEIPLESRQRPRAQCARGRRIYT